MLKRLPASLLLPLFSTLTTHAGYSVPQKQQRALNLLKDFSLRASESGLPYAFYQLGASQAAASLSPSNLQFQKVFSRSFGFKCFRLALVSEFNFKGKLQPFFGGQLEFGNLRLGCFSMFNGGPQLYAQLIKTCVGNLEEAIQPPVGRPVEVAQMTPTMPRTPTTEGLNEHNKPSSEDAATPDTATGLSQLASEASGRDAVPNDDVGNAEVNVPNLHRGPDSSTLMAFDDKEKNLKRLVQLEGSSAEFKIKATQALESLAAQMQIKLQVKEASLNAVELEVFKKLQKTIAQDRREDVSKWLEMSVQALRILSNERIQLFINSFTAYFGKDFQEVIESSTEIKDFWKQLVETYYLKSKHPTFGSYEEMHNNFVLLKYFQIFFGFEKGLFVQKLNTVKDNFWEGNNSQESKKMYQEYIQSIFIDKSENSTFPSSRLERNFLTWRNKAREASQVSLFLTPLLTEEGPREGQNFLSSKGAVMVNDLDEKLNNPIKTSQAFFVAIFKKILEELEKDGESLADNFKKEEEKYQRNLIEDRKKFFEAPSQTGGDLKAIDYFSPIQKVQEDETDFFAGL